MVKFQNKRGASSEDPYDDIHGLNMDTVNIETGDGGKKIAQTWIRTTVFRLTKSAH